MMVRTRRLTTELVALPEDGALRTPRGIDIVATQSMEHHVAPLTIAIGNYGLTRALKDKRVASERLDLDYLQIDPITAAMRRMVRGLEFDICEMALTTYLCAKEAGKPFTAIPVFLTRN